MSHDHTSLVEQLRAELDQAHAQLLSVARVALGMNETPATHLPPAAARAQLRVAIQSMEAACANCERAIDLHLHPLGTDHCPVCGKEDVAPSVEESDDMLGANEKESSE